jgi:predicted component of viral defense system (DUF524 family)
MNSYSAIAIRLEADTWWVLSTPGCPAELDPANGSFPEIRPGLRGHAVPGDGLRPPPIVLDQTSDGAILIRLLETQRYDWDVTGREDVTVTSTLEALPGRQWSVRRVRSVTGSFAVVNHLGMADFRLSASGKEHRFALEIISRKLDYHTEFRQITEDIADFCQQLLLNWDAPTSLNFGIDPEEAARLMLEQFLFLRSHLEPERLGEILESIQRRPNSILKRETHWTPSACAGSQDWLRDAVGMARDWRRPSPGARPLPSQVLDVRKEDSVDTAPNRFVKFALAQFRDLCRKVVDEHPEAQSLAHEAAELGSSLDAALARPFFRGLGTLTRLPLDSPVLQKRNGYRDILRAWLLTQAASALSWDRDEDSYHGPTRNVATLYEYWIFLQLHQILDDLPGVSRDEENPKPSDDAERFLEMKNGELVINLKRGRKTCAAFTITLETGMELRLHLYYERTFQVDSGATEATSYSRQFKPDYTLAIFPKRFETEADAASDGKIAYVHFDAKYRAENMKMIFGDLLKDEELDAALDADKLANKATSTYQRGDLLKMHTYNDAVRQTAGSYVLYPGSDQETRMDKFHEIVPGVGAFVLKPGNEGCRTALKDFLMDVFRHQSNQFTQYRHYSDVLHATVREEPWEYGGLKTFRPDATCVLVYVKEAVRDLSRSKRLVYCRVLKDDESRTPIRIKLGNLSGAVLCPYQGSRSGPKTSLSWQASVVSCEMMSREQLCGILTNEGWPQAALPETASAYLLFRLDEPSTVPSRRVTELTPGGSYEAVSKTLRELDACPVAASAR